MLSQLAVGYRFFKMWTSAINACSHMSIPQETKQPSKPLSILDYDLTQYALYVAIDQAECKLDLSVGVKARRESKVAISSNLILSVHNLSFTQTFDSLFLSFRLTRRPLLLLLPQSPLQRQLAHRQRAGYSRHRRVVPQRKHQR